mgnify:CR=1 FL=1
MYGDNFQITFYNDYVIMRTLDNIDFPVEIWRFKMSDLSSVERAFVDNMLSMSKSMITKKEQDERNKPEGN